MLRHAVLALVLVGVPLAVSAGRAAEKPVDFNREIRPLLSGQCFACHGPDADKREAGLRLDQKAGALAELDSGLAAVVPGNSTKSELLRRLTSDDEAERMPPAEHAEPLTKEQIELVKRWIDEGAPWQVHWSYVKPERHPLPKVKQTSWPASPIDYFVLARLEHDGLTPSPEADRYALVRRVTLDLTGLPPTPDAVSAFVNDDRPDAYKRLVDRLLRSPAYGERWARLWLDLARYADSQGYEKDNRRTIWRYRDWVIDALNRDMPLDRFTIEQMAGDLLPGATLDQVLATAFHRNTMTNTEGGTDDEEWRTAAVVDRVNTTMQVWMGTTMGCAQCHSHKYDPISQREYYEFFALLNQTEDSDKDNEQPIMPTPTGEQQHELAAIADKIAAAEQVLKAGEPQLESLVAELEKQASGELPQAPAEGLVAGYGLDGNAYDSSGHDRHGVDQAGDPAFEAGIIGQAGRFDGKRYIDVDGVGDFERTDAFSYGAWIQPTTQEPLVPIARLDDRENYRGYDLYLYEGTVYAHLIHQWPDSAIRVITTQPLATNQWHHVMVTYDGSGKAAGVRIYVNGRPAATSVTSDNLNASIKTESPFRVGGRYSKRFFQGLIDDVRVYNRRLSEDEVQQVAAHGILSTPPDRRTDAQKELVRDYFRTRAMEQLPAEWQQAAAELKSQRKAEQDLRGKFPTTPILRELAPDKRRTTHVHVRGSFLSPGEEVSPGVPAAFQPLADDAPRNRLGLAGWLVDENNPLTARVAANRYWEQFFGIGLVETGEDFGSQGTPPSHPELLDWLATELMRQGWSLKELCRTIVMSQTYRQSSRVTPELLDKDPQNRLLARGPRFRLEAEMVRDQALAVSGLLSRKMHGPSVMPPQPPGVWQIVYSGDKWETSSDEDQYRRGLYTFWRRTSPYPAMMTFDATSREVCTIRRIRTNTPLQALVTMNDPAFVEAARALARLTIDEAGASAEERAAYGFRRVLARPPRPDELQRVVALYRSELEHYAADPEAARQMATGEVPNQTKIENPKSKISEAELAAWTVVSNVLLNLDEALTKD